MSDMERSDYLIVDHLRTETEREIKFREGTPSWFQYRISDHFRNQGFTTQLSSNCLIVTVRT